MRAALEVMTKNRNELQAKIDEFITDANDDLRIKLMLMKRPEEACEAALQKWDQTKDLKVASFEKYKLSDVKLFDPLCFYDKWSVGAQHFEGMRHPESNKAFGVCRVIDETGIIEAQWKHGARHGLSVHY